MTNQTNQPTYAGTRASNDDFVTEKPPAQHADVRRALLRDIRLKWSKFTDLELGGLRSNDDLVSQVAAKYGLDKAEAQRNVDELRAGRDI
jgi:hypothetical protein